MAFGKAPCIPAHHGGNPLLPRRDRTLEAAKSRNPPVPRAPRAKPRANSLGALSRELKKGSENSSAYSTPSRLSESRRPAAESPFSYARVHLLNREQNAVENQVFEMGPHARSSSVDHRNDFQRGPRLGQERNQGMPWEQPKEKDGLPLPKARRWTLLHEQLAADPSIEAHRAQAKGDQDSEIRNHGRVHVYAREVGNAHQALEIAPMVQVCGLQADTVPAVERYHGRRNILARETAEDSTDGPTASSFAGDGAPSYGRRSRLPPPADVKASCHPIVPRAPLAAR